MTFWKKNNLYILTLASICVLCYVLIRRSGIPEMQRVLGLYVFGMTLHEWEESRFPGGFYELMSKKFGIPNLTQDSMNTAHGVVVVAIFFLSYIQFLLPNITWLAMVPAMLGIFEAMIHVAGIWIHKLKKPYTPGMLTAVLVLLPLSVRIISIGGAAVGWMWFASAAYYLCAFAVMEILTLRAFGTSPKQVINNVRAERTRQA